MIEREGNDIQLTCDYKGGCKAATDVYNKQDFNVMIKDAKADGWKIYPVNGEWRHFCQWSHGDD